MPVSNYKYTSLLLAGNEPAATNDFVDWSPHNHSVSTHGGVDSSATQSKYYGTAMYFDGASDYLRVPKSSVFELDGEFTIEAWLYAASISGPLSIINSHDTWSSSVWGVLEIAGDGKIGFLAGDTLPINISSNAAITVNTWTHVAVTRNAANLVNMYIDGVKQTAEVTSSATLAEASMQSTGLNVGSNTGSGHYLNGYLNDLRITKGKCRYTAAFTPPTRLIGTQTGNIKDDTGTNAVRDVVIVPTGNPSRSFNGVSGADGNYSIDCPAELSAVIVVDDDAGTDYDDIVTVGVTPA